MSLLEPPVEKPQKSRAMAITIGALVFTLVVVLWFTFRYYPEKKAAARFFNALAAGDTSKAYELWKPSASYRLSDFTADWGPGGYYGPVKSYKIMSANVPKQNDSIEGNVDVSTFSARAD